MSFSGCQRTLNCLYLSWQFQICLRVKSHMGIHNVKFAGAMSSLQDFTIQICQSIMTHMGFYSLHISSIRDVLKLYQSRIRIKSNSNQSCIRESYHHIPKMLVNAKWDGEDARYFKDYGLLKVKVWNLDYLCQINVAKHCWNYKVLKNFLRLLGLTNYYHFGPAFVLSL